MKNIHLSETKLNQLATEISNRLFESHYFNQDNISGEALNNFCDHEQINKFLLFQVYQVWQLQISRFKHPYFNFEHAEVKDLLAKLQNLLSRNIAINKDDFKSLLYKAVLNNLRLLTNPKASLQQFFFQNQEKIAIQLYEKYVPFFSDFDFVTNSILRYFKKNEIKTAESDVFSLKFDRVLEVYNQRSEQNDDTYRSLRFYKLTGRRLEEVIQEDKEEIEARQKREEIEEANRKLREQKEKEAEATRLAAQRKAAEEARRQKEAEVKKKSVSFFDEIPAHEEVHFDLDADELAEKEKSQQPTSPTKSSRVVDQIDQQTSTVKDTIQEEQSVWKSLKDKGNTIPTQADKLKENANRQSNSLIDRLKSGQEDKNKLERKVEGKATQESDQITSQGVQVEKKEAKKDDTPKPELSKQKASIEIEDQAKSDDTQSTEPLISSSEEKTSFLEDLKAMDNKVETLLDKVKEEPTADTKPSIIEQATKPDQKPSSLVDLLKNKDTAQEKIVPTSDLKSKVEEAVVDPEEPKSSSSGSLLDRFKKKTQDTISEVKPAASEGKPLSVADRFKSKQGSSEQDSVKSTYSGKAVKADEIPIHKQYRFVQKVFGGNNVRFRIIVDKINNAKSAQEVESILDKYVFNNPDVNREDETVKEFVQLMRG